MSNRFKKQYNYKDELIEPKHVQVYIHFGRIGEIDTMNEKYQAEFTVESSWISNEPISNYDPNVHWNPKLYIENAIQEPKESIKYSLSRDANNNCIITEIRQVKGTFWERLELQNFPFDVQELSIIVTSKLSPYEVKLEKDNLKISHIDLEAAHRFVEQQKWKLFKLVTVSETASYDAGGSALSINDDASEISEFSYSNVFKHSKVAATCYCARKAGYYLFNAYFLIFLITAAAMTIFSIDCKLPQNRLQTTCTFLLTSVSFKWVINRSLPTISYLTSLDKYAIICIFFVVVMCAWHAIIGSYWTKDEAKIIDQWVLVSFAAIFFLIHIGYFIWFMMAYNKIRKIRKQEKIFLQGFKEFTKEAIVRKNMTRV